LLSQLPGGVKELFTSTPPMKESGSESLLTNLQQYLQPTLNSLQTQLTRLSRLLPQQPRNPTPTLDSGDTLLDRIYTTCQSLLLHLQATEPTLVAATVLTLILLARLSMSWSSRFPQLGRFSPFTRSGTKTNGEVSDSDFSYITAEDLQRSQDEQAAAKNASSTPSHNRDTDVLILKHKRISYPVHFLAHSIDRDELTIGDIRAAAAKKLNIPTSGMDRIKMFWKGKNLKDDKRTARQEGLRSDV